MSYTKIVKALNQGVTGLTIPKAFCAMLNIKPGDNLAVTLDYENQQFTVKKINIKNE